jgi:hypothetical protein
MAVNRSRDEDHHLGSTADGRKHRVPDPTLAAVLSPTNRAAQRSTTSPSRPELAGRLLGDLLRRTDPDINPSNNMSAKKTPCNEANYQFSFSPAPTRSLP